MMKKISNCILVFMFFVTFNQLNAQFEFQYSGPDTLYLDNDCQVILDWGHPATPTVNSTVGNTITYFDIFSISDGYINGSTITEETSINIIYKAIDDQLNSAFFSFTIAIKDTIRPIIITLPSDKSLTCETPESTIAIELYNWYAIHANMIASDNCGEIDYIADKTLEETETAFNQSINDNCGSTRSVTVIYSAMDQYGNTSANTYAATFFTFDNKKPIVIVNPTPLDILCNEATSSVFEAWIDDKGGSRVMDNCSDSASIKWFFVWNDNVGGSDYEEVGDKPYSLKNKKTCDYSGNINFIARDECGNQHAAFFTTFKITDESIPVFSSLPQDTTIDCSSDIPRPTVTAYDACKGILAVNFVETSTRSSNTDSCSYYSYQIYQSWAANDECGHPISNSRKITVIDTLVPDFIAPPDMLVGCTDYQNLDITGRPMNVIDNCDTDPLVIFTDEKIGDACQYHIFRKWKISDVCNNSIDTIQDLTIIDTIYPVVMHSPEDLIINCDSTISFMESFNIWISNRGFAEITDNCNKVYSFTAEPGSYTLGLPGTYPGVAVAFDMPDTLSCSVDSLLYYKDVDFVFYDRCHNTLSFTRRFAIIDNVDPVLINCPLDTSYIMEPGFCERTVILTMPEVSDNCTGDNLEIKKTITKAISSNVQGSYEIPVNPVTLNIGPFSGLEKIPQEILNFNLHFENIDADDINEFFFIVNEDGDTIGTTPIIANQCEDFDMELKDLFTLEQTQNWIVDGYLTITLLPNIPPGNGVFAINDICQGTSVAAKFIYFRENPNKLEYFVKIDDGDYSFAGNGQAIDTSLSIGPHIIHHKVMDCGKNEIQCQNNITIEDNENPEIICPTDIYMILPMDTCIAEVPLPVDFIVNDNCSNTFDNFIRVPADTSKSFITFNFNPEYNEYVANSKIFVFENISFDLLLFNPTLKVKVTGDIDEINEYFEILNENGQIIGTTSKSNIYTTPGNCDNPSFTNLNIEINDLSLWANDGIISFTARPANTSNRINPCNPVTVDGADDGKSKILMTLEFQKLDISFLSTGANTTGKTKLNHSSRFGNNFSSGISDITYIIDDGSGNRDSCSFKIEVIDDQPPVAHCKNFYVLLVSPSGTESGIIDPNELNDNSTDNCGIDFLSVFPSAFDCTSDNSNQEVQLTVWDKAGNSDSCKTNILVKVAPLTPTYSSGVCVHDSLKLFANLPNAPANIWTIEWTGPNGFVSNTENPVRPNADASYSGTYVLTVTGFNGCTSTGTVEVIIEDLSRPLINAKKTKVCVGEKVLIESTAYSSSVKYHWYKGSYPVGTFIDSTSNPFITVTPVPGNNFYYVIAKSDKCQSLASFSTSIEVVPKPNASIQDPFISLCEGEVFSPKAGSNGSAYVYKWWGPNGYQSNDQNPVALANVSILNQGTYYLEVNNLVCSDTAKLELVVFDKPATPKIESDTLYCKNKPIVLSITNIQNADNYIWYLNDNLYVNQSSNSLIIPEAKPQFEGSWKAFVKNGNCYSDTSQAVVIKIETEYQINASNNGPICEGDTIKLFAPPVTNASYKWTGPEGFSSNEQNPIFNSAKSGEYQLSVTTQAGCKYFSSTYFEVKPKPRITALSTNAPNCLSGTDCVSFVPTVYPFGTQFNYKWIGPNGYNSTALQPEICNFQISDNGIYSLVVSDAYCSSDTSFIEIKSNQRPELPVLEENKKVCEGDSIILNILNNVFPDGTNYHWTISPSSSQVTTTKPFLIIPEAATSNTGIFNVFAEKDGCFSDLSDDVFISVIKRPNQPLITGTNKVCEGATIELKTSYLANGKYSWSGPSNFSSTAQNPKIFPAVLSNSGVYTLTVAVEMCQSVPSEGFIVEVAKLPLKPELVSVDSSFCVKNGNSSITLCLKNIEAGTNYLWYHNALPAVLISESSSPCIEVNNFELFLDGLNSIFVIASRDVCKSENSSVESFVVNKVPARIADAGDDVFTCNPDNALIAANPDPEGSWSAFNSAPFISNPNKSSTNVYDLEFGSNPFIWSLSHGVCKDFSSDTAIVYLEYYPDAMDDEYTTPYNTSISFDPVENDIYAEGSDITVKEYGSSHGIIDINNNGIVTYTPEPGFIGQVLLIYKITKAECSDNYDEANIIINVGDKNDCFGVNVITPNGDGVNDNLIFPCLETNEYSKNELLVFNQWGDQVYSAFNYRNDWQGTYNGKGLPVGTYFYILFLDSNRKNTINGFFVIER